MKLLRLIHVLTSLAVAYSGFLIMRFGDVVPAKWALPLTTMLIGFPTMLIGIGAGVVYLLSLLWLIVAYEPQLDAVEPKKIKARFTILLSLIAFDGTAHCLLRPHPRPTRLTFTDPVIAVRDSMRVLRQLCESVDKKHFYGYYVGPDSTLVFSRYLTHHRQDSLSLHNVPRTRLTASLGVYLGRIDTVTSANSGFDSIKKDTVIRMLSLLKFLNRNQVRGVIHDGPDWKYPYGMDDYRDSSRWFNRDKEEEQYLFIYNTPKDTIGYSTYSFIRNRNNHMILYEGRRNR
ncbi:hypothetical protein CLV58_109100 [Spirosoma oryzae]|uniref:Uncharacterized protein n=1 Tax=Spirosoma oryzae TaxID=1469603 RepID=A0A2T0SYD9_9BACT|nr:hypothetical protein [Spirosoma oryzae]PRY38373.1 hypothetical protein CLV58_109100 [Spirosoma oryzae]